MIQAKPTIRVALADDHEIFRDGLCVMLERQNNIDVVGDANNGLELLKLAREHTPDVILTDISMPQMDGIAATKAITTELPQIGIIALSMHEEDQYIVDMLEAGAKGYLLKNANKEIILEAIESVYMGNPFYCRNTNTKLTQMIARSKFNPYKKKDEVAFTDREKEIIKHIAEGLTNKEIGNTLFISSRTVEGHRLKIMEKMGVSNMVGIVIYAVKNKLLEI